MSALTKITEVKCVRLTDPQKLLTFDVNAKVNRKISGDKIEDVRLAIGSMAVTPVRLRRTEQVLAGQPYSAALMSEARQAMEAEVAPIDDIRSSADYRLHVAGNLLQEFLEGLFQ